MTYKPDWNHPTVKSRCLKVIEFIDLYLKPGEVRPVAQTQFTKYWGNTARPLAQYLKTHLLECVDSHWNMATGQCKRYRQRHQAVKDLKQQLGLINLEPTVKQAVLDQLTTGQIEYKERGHRLYHELQNYPKRVKRTILARSGYDYEYDIQCCAQTLLLQHSRHLGFSLATPHLDEYIENRTQIRQDLSEELGLDKQTIKKILHALLTGAQISTRYNGNIYAYVNFNRLMISQLKQNTWIQQYQQELRLMWKSIRSQRSMNKGERLNARMKSEIYRELEGQVRKSIVRYLKKTKNQHFFEHDGWSARKAVDIRELVHNVKRTTGFLIGIDWTIYE